MVMPAAPFEDPPLRHGHGNIECILCTCDSSHILSNYVKRGPVRGCSDGDRQSTLNGNTAIKGEELHSDLALIMVHGQDAVEMLPLEEYGVTGKRALDIDALLPGGLDCWPDVVNFLAPECSVFAIVWIERADTQPRRLYTGFPPKQNRSAKRVEKQEWTKENTP